MMSAPGIARLLLAVAVGACAPRTPAVEAAPDSSTAQSGAPGGDSAAVTLERTPCFGTCPVYRVSVAPSGAVRFVGTHHVARQGAATADMGRERVDSLVRALEAGGYFGFADEYVMNAPACGQYATDSPTVITSVTAGGRTKRIRHDYGCFAAPRDLSALERLIDEAAGTAAWVGGR